MKRSFISLTFLLLSIVVLGQDRILPLPRLSNTIGLELQAYPAGLMPGIVFEKRQSFRHAFHLRAGLNFADRHDWGKHDDETGWGYGGTLGYRYYFKTWNQEFSVGPRIDIWKMTIDWVGSNATGIPNTTGSTDITVFQPTLEVAWWLPLKDSGYSIGVSVTNGFEINVKTNGEEVGEGLISLIGITARKSLN